MSMTEQDRVIERMVFLLELVRGGIATPDETRELRFMLRDSGNQGLMAELLIDESLLRDELLGDETADALIKAASTWIARSTSEGPQTNPTAAMPRPNAARSYFRIGAIPIAASLSGAACVLLLQALLSDPTDRVATVATQSTEDDSLGPEAIKPRLVSTTGCIWAERGPVVPAIGQGLGRGEVLRLIEGVAALEIGRPGRNRARVRVEGPAGVFVRSDGFIGLQSGALLADTQWATDDFPIDTPAGQVFPIGASRVGIFSEGGEVQVHVLFGQARIQSPLLPTDKSEQVLEEGEAIKLTSDQAGMLDAERLAASPDRFGAMLSMNLSQLFVGRKYKQAVLKSKPAVYWDFEQRGEVADRSEGGVTIDGQIEGELPWQYSGANSYVSFGQAEMWGFVKSASPWPVEPLDEYSIELWVKPSHFQQAALVSLAGDKLPDGRCAHSLILEIGGPSSRSYELSPSGSIRFLHRSPMSGDYYAGASCFSDTRYVTRRWQHLVARKRGAEIGLFIDGVKVASAAEQKPLPAGTTVVLGQLYPDKSERPFIGLIDEVALYERALTDQEIKHHFYEARVQTGDDESI